MAESGASYADALAEAQALGYAEADPTDDVTGKDAAAKMAILARLAFGTPVSLAHVRYEGIEHLTADAVCVPPAPGPESVISVMAGDSMVTALKEPFTDASGWSA